MYFSTKEEIKVAVNEDEELKAHTRSQGPVAKQQSNEEEINEETQRLERKENLKKKEKTFLKEIKKGQSMSGVQPVGIDRLFRRYWTFNSLNGLFIEDNDPNLPKLLQAEEEPSNEVCSLDVLISFYIYLQVTSDLNNNVILLFLVLDKL